MNFTQRLMALAASLKWFIVSGRCTHIDSIWIKYVRIVDWNSSSEKARTMFTSLLELNNDFNECFGVISQLLTCRNELDNALHMKCASLRGKRKWGVIGLLTIVYIDIKVTKSQKSQKWIRHLMTD